MTVASRIATVGHELEQVAPQKVRLLAVTKTVDLSAIYAAYDAGIRDMAENRVEALLERQLALADFPITWHLIGHLQSRKVKSIINHIDYFHALDSLKLAKVINKHALGPIKCFVQVNISQEPSKYGLLASEVPMFCEALRTYTNICVVGLMTMAPKGADEVKLRGIFSQAKTLQQHIQALNITNCPCTELSMGMSGDYQIAVQEGATMVRLGQAIFSSREKHGI